MVNLKVRNLNQFISFTKERYDALKEIELADDIVNDQVSTKAIDILVGADHYWEFATGRIIRVNEGLTAVHTTLGWVLNGNVPTLSKSPPATSLTITAHVLIVETEVSLGNQLRRFWEIESVGGDEVDSFDSDAFILIK